ncbi:MAG: tRNA (adenosine(37)-N6)-threonylcarbamoyltransferase complex transferase subunit TsaD [Patescibacteria group bacterium]|jgi:N6-L-threonylcarbamoyladenine synthase|nr:tRNA (adenosine(37)-N6)-threonylcarbamoyltransferase complex transferase subunit TsaD [Patescibacteria group bacterium]
MKILGIESSCDETAAAVVKGTGDSVKVLSNIVSSQIDIHKKYGGVIPEVAAREHVLDILPVVDTALKNAGINKKTFSKELDAIAIATGPGLVSSLMVGIETAKTLSYIFDVPIVNINHIEGHIYANFIDSENIEFPAVVLTVSGGHTMLILMKGFNKFETLGETRDDAAGEAFDKAAQLMDIGYPGGPIISQLAETSKEDNTIKLPRPMIDSPNFEFSFSGLKTALLYQLQSNSDFKNKIPEYCQEFQQAIIDVLIKKTIKAATKYSAKSILLAGGVSANKELRLQLENSINKKLAETIFFKPKLAYTTDNAAMIASAGYFKARDKIYTKWRDIKVNPNLAL